MAITEIDIELQTAPLAVTLEVLQGLPGSTGKSAYQSYLDTTADDPPMTEEEWSALGGGGASHDPVTVSGNGISLTGQQISLSIGTGATQVAAGNHTHAQLHDAATVSGNGIQISNQQISLSIGAGATQVAAGNHTHTAAAVGAVGLTGNETVAGNKTLSGQTELTGQSAATATSAMNRYLVESASLFSMLTSPTSDIGTFTVNSGAGAAATADGDVLSSGTSANARPNVYRWRTLDRNPSGSGSTTTSVRAMRLSSMGTAYHSGSANAAGKLRCGLGIVTGASAPAGEAQPLAGRGWGWEIFWDASTSKIRFRLFAHNGSVFVTNDGLSGRADSIDTGISPSDPDAMFFVCLGLAADGTVSAWAAFGTLNQIRAANRVTPVLTLAGGPTSGTVASTGYPSWHCVNHSTTPPSIGMQFRISARSLVLD